MQVTDPYSILEALLDLKPTQISKRGERTTILLTQPEPAAITELLLSHPATVTFGLLIPSICSYHNSVALEGDPSRGVAAVNTSVTRGQN